MMTWLPSSTTARSSSRPTLSSSSTALMASTSQFSPWLLPWSSLNLVWVVAVLQLFTASVNEGMHINKCCGAKEQLNDYLNTCVPYEGPMAAALIDRTSTISSTTSEGTTINKTSTVASTTAGGTTIIETSTVASTTAEGTTIIETFTATAPPITTILSMPDEPTTAPPGEVILDGGLPYWIDPNLTVLEAHSHQPLEGGKAWERARATVGNRPCLFSDTQYMYTLRREMYQLLSNGSLLLPMWRTDADGTGRFPIQVALPPNEWCMDRVTNGYFVFLTCPCQRVTCLNRCCSRKKMYEAQRNRTKLNTKCKTVENATAFMKDPVFYNGMARLNESKSDESKDETGAGDGEGVVYTELFAHTVECEGTIYGKYLLKTLAEKKSNFWVQRNGSVIVEDYNHGRPYRRQHVCQVEVQTTTGDIISDLFFCHKRATDSAPAKENVYYSLLFLLGSFFLLLTLLVHALVPELRRSAHAKALMCHCASLLVASVTLTAGHLHRRATQPFCSLSAFIVQFFFLSTFFWLNVMCFDLSWTFGAMRRLRVPSAGGDRSKRFLWYSLYGWGCPGLISAITLFMEYAPANIVPPDLALLPNIGARRCWFDTKTATFVYYYGPVALLLVVNLALFAFTVVRIKHSRRGTSILRKGSANARSQGGTATNISQTRPASAKTTTAASTAATAATATPTETTTTATTAATTATATAAVTTTTAAGGVDVHGDTIVASSEDDSERVSEVAAKTASKTAEKAASVKSTQKSVMKSGDRQMLIVFTKLFCLMGVTWVTEIVSWLAGDSPIAFWYVTDAVNLLRGVLIFVFFCCKPAALRPLRARMRACAQRCCPAALRLGASRKQPRVSISTLESSLSMPDMMDSTATAVVPAAPGAASAIGGVKDDAL